MTVGLQQIMPAIEYIGMHYMNPISGEDLASICSLSEAQLRRKFKEYLNMSPVEYLTMVRIQKAYELLNSTNYPMTEVALRVGYQDVSSFNRNFQKIMGVSPYQYKKTTATTAVGYWTRRSLPRKDGSIPPIHKRKTSWHCAKESLSSLDKLTKPPFCVQKHGWILIESACFDWMHPHFNRKTCYNDYNKRGIGEKNCSTCECVQFFLQISRIRQRFQGFMNEGESIMKRSRVAHFCPFWLPQVQLQP